MRSMMTVQRSLLAFSVCIGAFKKSILRFPSCYCVYMRFGSCMLPGIVSEFSVKGIASPCQLCSSAPLGSRLRGARRPKHPRSYQCLQYADKTVSPRLRDSVTPSERQNARDVIQSCLLVLSWFHAVALLPRSRRLIFPSAARCTYQILSVRIRRRSSWGVGVTIVYLCV